MIFKSLVSAIILSVVFATTAHAGIGRLQSIRLCVNDSSPQKCTTQKISGDRACSVTTTSLSNGLIGDSDFRGVYSIPAAGKSDKIFKSSVVLYSADENSGVVRGPFGGSQIGEWVGKLQKSTGNKYKVNIRSFYLYQPAKAGYYLEYHCRM